MRSLSRSARNLPVNSIINLSSDYHYLSINLSFLALHPCPASLYARAYTMDHDDFRRRVIVIKVSSLAAMISALVVVHCVVQCASRYDKVPQHISILSGQAWINELLAGHDGRFYNEMGMQKHVFWHLLSVLRKDASLHNTRHVSCGEQLAIFLHYARRGLSNRALQERFQRSPDTVSK